MNTKIIITIIVALTFIGIGKAKAEGYSLEEYKGKIWKEECKEQKEERIYICCKNKKEECEKKETKEKCKIRYKICKEKRMDSTEENNLLEAH